MEISVKNEDLLTAIQLVRPAIDTRVGFESSNLYIKALNVNDKGWLYLYCSNFYSQVITKIEVTVKEDGEILITPQKLVDTLRTADKELMVNMKTDDKAGKVKVKTKLFSFTLSCDIRIALVSGKVKDQYPLKEKPIASIDLTTLMEFYKRSNFCTVPTVSGTTQFNAIRINFGEKSTGVTATDRLIAADISKSIDNTNPEATVLIDKDAYALMYKAFADQKDSIVTITYNESKTSVFFSANNTIYGAKVFSGGFPDIKSLLIKQPSIKLILNTKEALSVAQRARIFSNENRTVKFTATASKVELTTFAEKGKDGSEFSEAIEVLVGSETIGIPEEGLTIYVDIDYVINVLSTSSSVEITLGLNLNTNPAIRFLESPSDDNHQTKVDYIMIGKTKW